MVPAHVVEDGLHAPCRYSNPGRRGKKEKKENTPTSLKNRSWKLHVFLLFTFIGKKFVTQLSARDTRKCIFYMTDHVPSWKVGTLLPKGGRGEIVVFLQPWLHMGFQMPSGGLGCGGRLLCRFRTVLPGLEKNSELSQDPGESSEP